MSMDQKFMKCKVILDPVFRLKCLVNSFTDISFTVVVYEENAFWDFGFGIYHDATGENQGIALSRPYNTSMFSTLHQLHNNTALFLIHMWLNKQIRGKKE